MIDPASYVGDDLVLVVTVREGADDGPPKDLTGASVQAKAQRPGTAAAPAEATVSDPVSGEITLDFGPRLNAPGRWRIQARVTLDGVSETVLFDVIEVRASIL